MLSLLKKKHTTIPPQIIHTFIQLTWLTLQFLLTIVMSVLLSDIPERIVEMATSIHSRNVRLIVYKFIVSIIGLSMN